MSNRRQLPNRRASENISYRGRNDMPITATVGYYPNGDLGEVFLRSGRAGTDLSIAMLEAGIALSFALQHGADPAIMRQAFPRDGDGRAEGAIGQILDILARPVLEVVS